MSRQILISVEEPWYVAKDIATGIASQGLSIKETKKNLKEALKL